MAMGGRAPSSLGPVVLLLHRRVDRPYTASPSAHAPIHVNVAPFWRKVKKEGSMPRLMKRDETPLPEPHVPETWCDALLVNGLDPSALRRARIRALNNAR